MISLAESVDVRELQRMADAVHHASGMPIGFFELTGARVVTSGWHFPDSAPDAEGHFPKNLEQDRHGNELAYPAIQNADGSSFIRLPILLHGEPFAICSLGPFRHGDTRPSVNPDDTRAVPVLSQALVSTVAEYGRVLSRLVSTMAETRRRSRRDVERRRQVQGGPAAVNEMLTDRLAAMDQAPDGMVIVDASGLVVYANQAQADFYEYQSVSDLVGQHWRIFLSPESEAELSQTAVPVVKREGRWKGEVVGRKSSGALVLHQLSIASLDNGGAIGIVRDCAASRHVEDALLESVGRLRELLENVNSIAVMLDTQGRISFCNEFLLQLSGFTRAELIGQDWFAIMLPEQDRDRVRDMFLSGLRTGKIGAHARNPIRTKSGHHRMIAWDNAVLRDPAGKIIGTASIGRDVTTDGRLEEQLRQSQKMEAIGRLAGGVAHDFNNILTGILGYAEMLVSHLPTGTCDVEYAIEIRNAARLAAGLTAQLLAFSRKQVIAPIVLDLNKAIALSRKMISRIIGEDVDLRFSPGEPIHHVCIDPTQLEQVLVNLAANARDAMPGGGRLTIQTQDVSLDPFYCRLHADAKPGAWVLLSVGDTGVGIPDTVLEHIFEPFFTTKAPGEGTGLGLATVYGIVSQNQGFIRVQTDPAVGTSFLVYLPQVDEPSARPRTPVPERSKRGRERILLVEDDDVLRRFISLALESEGYTVIAASEAESAWQLGRDPALDIDLLLTDVVMPGIDGSELFERLREKRPHLRVLFMSGYTDMTIAVRGVLDSGKALIAKPFSTQQLLGLVRHRLDA